MPHRKLNLSLDLELEGNELHGLCRDGNGGDRRFHGWLGLIGALDALVEQGPGAAPIHTNERGTPMLTAQESHLADLRHRIDGDVHLAGDAGWDEARQAFNLLVDQQPAAVVEVANAEDVVETVRFAGERGLRVAPQGAAHNAGPIAGLEDALLVRTGALREVTIDVAARRARVGAGVKWGEVSDAVSPHGLSALSGSARDVGVAGYSLGGGIGWLARRHGLQANALTAAEIVTPDAELRRIDHSNDAELFWAIRGGGGNFGVVTALEFELFETPEIYAGALLFPFERAPEVMRAWHEWVSAGLPEEITTVGRVMQFPDLDFLPELIRGKSLTIVQAAFLGSAADGEELLRPMGALGPDLSTFGMVEPAALGYLAMDPEDPMPYVGSHRILGELGAEGIDALLSAAGPGSGSGLASVELRSLGGALSRGGPGHGARATFDGAYLMFAAGAVMEPSDHAAVRAQAEGVARALDRWSVGRYLNFEEDPSDVRSFYDEPTWERLRAVRAQVDPNGRMLANHEIPA